MKDLHLIQRILLPNLSIKAIDTSYVRMNNALMRYDKGKIYFNKWGHAEFNTYYNALSLNVWKGECGLSELVLSLKGKGNFTANFYYLNQKNEKVALDSTSFELTENETCEVITIQISSLPSLGLLCFELYALDEDAELVSGEWKTPELPKRMVKLGIVVTHFNRKEYVLPSIKRIKSQLLEDPLYRDVINFTVVDNSKNISQEEAMGVNVIPNKNLGGSGGFMRGLLHYKNAADYTHVLFMDDDASCEIDSICRAFNILSHAKNDSTAIAGALLREDISYQLIEQGAFFDRVCIPLFHNLDIRSQSVLSEIEHSQRHSDYGAWWFFAFPLSKVKHWSFPFFVRGDDVLFSMINDFRILTTNGIACYGEDFSTKVSALTRYLDSRSGIVNMLLHENNPRNIIRAHVNLTMATLFSGQYQSVACIRKSIYDVAKGKEFWLENMDMAELRQWINENSTDEKMAPLDLRSYNYDINHNFEKSSRRWLRLLTLNGQILPSNDKTVLQVKGARASLRQIFRYKNIIYFDEKNSTGYFTTIDRIKFFKCLVKLLKDCVYIYHNFHKMKSKYNTDIDSLTSKEIWEDAYK